MQQSSAVRMQCSEDAPKFGAFRELPEECDVTQKKPAASHNSLDKITKRYNIPMKPMDISAAAAALGRLGGLKKSKRKTEAVRENARKPRPGRRKSGQSASPNSSRG